MMFLFGVVVTLLGVAIIHLPSSFDLSHSTLVRAGGWWIGGQIAFLGLMMVWDDILGLIEEMSTQ